MKTRQEIKDYISNFPTIYNISNEALDLLVDYIHLQIRLGYISGQEDMISELRYKKY